MNTPVKGEEKISENPLISQRKQNHIAICKNRELPIENPLGAGFDDVQFLHTALPELAVEAVSTTTHFLGKELSLPLFISCMTGGSDEGRTANRELAKAAEACRIPLGLGSMRVLLHEPERIADFAMREFAPSIPLMGNIGAVQLKNEDLFRIQGLIRELDLNCLVIHLNAGQELFQLHGDKDFTGLKSAIGKAAHFFDVPVIVKETGCGIRPAHVQELVELGVQFVDVAGSGGTNWMLIEECLHHQSESEAAAFATWGIQTAPLVDAVRMFSGKVLASGGIRTGMDVAKALALGASLAGMALPLFRAALDGGCPAVCRIIQGIQKTLQTVMILTGCSNIKQLSSAPLMKTLRFQHLVKQLQDIDLNASA